MSAELDSRSGGDVLFEKRRLIASLFSKDIFFAPTSRVAIPVTQGGKYGCYLGASNVVLFKKN